MTSDFSTRLFRIVFVLAGCYNLAFGVWVGFWPAHLFELLAIEQPRYLPIWSCVGMVVGVYGFLYWHVVWKPDRGRPIVAVGLLGKVLGPIGMALSFSDTWPLRLALLNLYNDVIWWLPFSLFLIRGTQFAKWVVPLAPWCCAVLHILGLLAGALALQNGTLAESDLLQRAAYIAQHPARWACGWSIWMFAAASLVAFYAWWGSRLKAPYAGLSAVLLAALGSVFDMSGESISILFVLERAQLLVEQTTDWTQAEFLWQERISVWLTAGAANLLYTLAGLLLMLRTRGLPAHVKWAMWLTWILGLVMTAAAVANHVGGMMVSTALLFPLLIYWTLWMGWRWRPD